MNQCAILDQIHLTKGEFDIELVQTEEQLHEVFRLRHQVYCVERKFEPAADGEETDEFDARSRHVLLRHSDSGEVVGTVRVIAPDPANVGAGLPMMTVCERALLRHLPLRATGEISRFAISKHRRTSCTAVTLLRLALMRGIVQLSQEMGLTHWLAVMERSLLRLHQSNAIHFEPIGPLVSYHGVRQPTSGAILAILARLKREQFPIWHYLTDGGAWFGGYTRLARAA